MTIIKLGVNRQSCIKTGLGLFKQFLLQALICCTVLGNTSAWASGQLMVAPTRVVFGERDRSATVNLVNTGDETTKYRISFVNKRMNDLGEFEEVDTPMAGERFAADMIRYSPRLVELPPGKSQTIRLLLRKPANLEEGEYRSHLHFKALPPETNKSIEALAPDGDNKLTIQLTPVIGVTIPVIVRHGKTDAQMQLDNLSLNETSDPNVPLVLGLSMHREGSRSIYGDITALFKLANGKELVIGKARGVAIYTPNLVRHVKMRLQPPPGIELKNGILRVVFEESNGGVSAEANANVQ